MKELFFNDKKVVIDQNIYFPFTQKVNDINNVDVIQFPATKNVDLPRCPENDEIFGYVAEINRIAVGYDDNLIGVSFNQIKRITYKLYNDSQLISEGIVRITSINDQNYSVELYDKLIDLFSQFDGDEATGEGYLNSLDLITSGTTFSMTLNAENIATLNEVGDEITPAVNLSEFLYKGNLGWVTYVPITGSSYYAQVELGGDMTPIQFGTLKPYDFEFNVPISTVINSINNRYSGITTITYDDDVKKIFDTVNFNLGKPKKIESKTYFTATGHTYNGLTSDVYTANFLFETTGSTQIAKQNGKYAFKIPISIEWIANSPSPYYTHQFVDGIHYNYDLLSTPLFGGYIGSMYVYTKLKTFDDNAFADIETAPVVSEIRMDTRIVGGNTTATYSGANITSMKTTTDIYVSFDYYYSIINGGNHDVYLDITLDPPDIFAYWSSGSLHQTGNTASLVFGNMPGSKTNLDLRCGDVINGQNLFPKVSISSFLLNIIKYYNFGVYVDTVSGNIVIHKKKYVLSDEILSIDDITELKPANFDFSRVVMSTANCSNANYKNYETATKQKYGNQIINTGYSIRNSKKDIKFDIAVPGFLKDTNSYAYTDFADYYNFGYSKTNWGSTEGLTETATIGYNYNTYVNIWVSNDLTYEANLSNGFSNTTEIKFTHNNLHLNYYEYTQKFSYPKFDVTGSTFARQLSTSYSLSPYQMLGSAVYKSVELNKPLYNFADLTDAQYSDTKTHYHNYWSNYIADLYNVNTHTLSTKIFISGVIDLYKIYNYKNNYYIINEITEYDPTVPAIYEIKLVRVSNLFNYVVSNVAYPFYAIYTDDLYTTPVCLGTGTTVWSNSPDPIEGDFIYSDSGLTTPFNLGGLLYIDSLKKNVLITMVLTPPLYNEYGQVIATGSWDCSGTTGGTTTTTTTMPPTTTTTTTLPGEYTYLARQYDCATCEVIGGSVIISNPRSLNVNRYYDDNINGNKWRIVSTSTAPVDVYVDLYGSGQIGCNGICI